MHNFSFAWTNPTYQNMSRHNPLRHKPFARDQEKKKENLKHNILSETNMEDRGS